MIRFRCRLDEPRYHDVRCACGAPIEDHGFADVENGTPADACDACLMEQAVAADAADFAAMLAAADDFDTTPAPAAWDALWAGTARRSAP